MLNGRSFIINGETVADEDAGKVLSDDLLQLLPSAMGNDAVERDLRIGENPEGVSGSVDILAGLIAVEDIAMADFSLQSLVFGSKLGGQAVGRSHQPSGSRGKPEDLFQEVATLALGEMPAVLKPGDQ